MGNCCRREFGDDDWNQSATPKKPAMEKESLLSDNKAVSSSSPPFKEELKIKITKRQLEELLKRVDMQDLTVEQALCRLVNSSADDLSDVQCHRPWRPRLHSIPEVN
ncbi:uncharacterized protein Adt_36373 [Abeliophyllum distichum]|uniref:Uncharacterized protein n=1 Tax=Abeliophyllum distichum TaxID=126358 RepID=A0ABD1QHE0_9LAMI